LRDRSAPVISGRTRAELSHVTNPIAIVLGILITVAIVVDVMLFGTDHMIFLGKKFFELIEWIAFWR
jgi:hypothetical protein